VSNEIDPAVAIAPPLVAVVVKLNPECGRCSAPATCAMASIGFDDIGTISVLTLCDPCAKRICFTLDTSHVKRGRAWVSAAHATDGPSEPD
jgi:hypothetical protein